MPDSWLACGAEPCSNLLRSMTAENEIDATNSLYGDFIIQGDVGLLKRLILCIISRKNPLLEEVLVTTTAYALKTELHSLFQGLPDSIFASKSSSQVINDIVIPYYNSLPANEGKKLSESQHFLLLILEQCDIRYLANAYGFRGLDRGRNEIVVDEMNINNSLSGNSEIVHVLDRLI